MNLKEKARNLPLKPGVYLMKDAYDNIIYVGKSKKLKSRVSSYFVNSKHHSPKVVKMIGNIRNFDFIITDTEFEAFLLECKLINDLKPMYNSLMKNRERYVYIKIAIKEEYPDILVSNERLQDGSLYFGPYSSHNTVEQAIEGIKEMCRIKCSTVGLKKQSKCLNYSLGLCMGMCQGDELKEEYGKVINRIIDLLSEKDDTILKNMETQMVKAAEELEFTEAAKYRDYISAVKYLIGRQKVVRYSDRNRNLAVLEELYDNFVKFFLIKGSKVIYQEKFNLNKCNYESIRDDMVNKMMNFFGDTSDKKIKETGKEEIDEAQIIYSYLKTSNNCTYTVIPKTWIAKKMDEKLRNAVDKICSKCLLNNIQ